MDPVSGPSSAVDAEVFNAPVEEHKEVEKNEEIEKIVQTLTLAQNAFNAELLEKIEALQTQMIALQAQQAAFVAKQEEAEEAPVAAPAKPAAPAAPAKPALHLKNISKKDLDKKDHALVKKHFKDGAKNAQWDAHRKVVILEKSAKYRAYRIGSGPAPAICESKHLKDVKNFVNNI